MKRARVDTVVNLQLMPNRLLSKTWHTTRKIRSNFARWWQIHRQSWPRQRLLRDYLATTLSSPIPVPLVTLVNCLFPTARPLTVTPVLMGRLSRPTDRPDDSPPSDYKLDRRSYTCLASLVIYHLGLKGSLIIGTVMNATQTKPRPMCVLLRYCLYHRWRDRKTISDSLLNSE